MKIHFGTPLTDYHTTGAFLWGCAIFAIGWFNSHLQVSFGEAEESVLRSRGLNVTTHTAPMFYCDLPYDDCRCLVLLNKSENSEKCITDIQLVGSRILPLVSFFLQIFLVRELFPFSADCPRVISCALWTTSLLIFIGMTISIYWSSCYHAHITFTLLSTGVVLCCLSLLNLMVNDQRTSDSSHGNRIVPVHRSERNHNASRAWQEFL
jgi:hypothetical protein